VAKRMPPEPPYRWRPLGTEGAELPEPGQIIAWRHEAWRVLEVNRAPEADWPDGVRQRMEATRPEFRDGLIPRHVIIRPASFVPDADPVRSRNATISLSSKSRSRWAWDVYPSEHYPVCARCGEPAPCREEMAREIGEKSEKDAARYEIGGVCPSCQEIPTARHKVITFEVNLRVPLGPPVTFHAGRQACRSDAAQYEREIAKSDPGYLMILNCPGRRLRHNYGGCGSECSEGPSCKGDKFPHVSSEWCNMCQICQDAMAGRETEISRRHASGDWTTWWPTASVS
jgi:hypothetical protein